MRIAITFRGTEPSEAIKQYANEKISKLQRYLNSPLDAEVVVTVEHQMHRVDVKLNGDNELIVGHEESDNMYASIDLVIDKLSRQIRKNHGLKAQHRRSGTQPASREK